MYVVDSDDHVAITDVGVENYLKSYVMFCGFTEKEEKQLKQVFFSPE